MYGTLDVGRFSGLLHETGSIAAGPRRRTSRSPAALRSPSRDRLHCGLDAGGGVLVLAGAPPVSFTRPAPLRPEAAKAIGLDGWSLRSPSRDRLHCGPLGDRDHERIALQALRSPSRDRLHCGQMAPSQPSQSARAASGLLHETGSIAARCRWRSRCCRTGRLRSPSRDRLHCGKFASTKLAHVSAELRSPSRDRLHCGNDPIPFNGGASTSSGLLHETGSIAARPPR